jgi:hypothetical protein
MFSMHYAILPSEKALARRLRHGLSGSAASGEAADIAAVRPPEGAGTWILAGFHDGIFCREAPR